MKTSIGQKVPRDTYFAACRVIARKLAPPSSLLDMACTIQYAYVRDMRVSLALLAKFPHEYAAWIDGSV